MIDHRLLGSTLLMAILVAGCAGVHPVPPIAAGAESPAKVGSDTLNANPHALNYRILHSFGTMNGDATWPGPGLINVNGTFYGSADGGGKNNNGAVYSITPAGTEKLMYSFGPTFSSDGSQPSPAAGLLDVAGTIYGTTYYGGKTAKDPFLGGGTVYSMNQAGTEKVVYSFDKSDHGAYGPQGALIDMNGALYGTTWSGGKYDDSTGEHGGTVFSVNRKTGTARILHSFGHGRDGRILWCTLLDVNGILYGVTLEGGSHDIANGGDGTVFSISANGTERILHSFNSTDGANPYDASGLIDVNGTLYGTTQNGGTYNLGTVFSISLTGTERVLHSFGSSGANPDGTQPIAGLNYVNGTLYGTTNGGGKYNLGTIFSISLTGAERVLHSFGKGRDGSNAQAGFLDVNGTLYGVTTHGGTKGYGTVYALTPAQ
jgi:uncharacterized repeat protein (TIGR03803 family)